MPTNQPHPSQSATPSQATQGYGSSYSDSARGSDSHNSNLAGTNQFEVVVFKLGPDERAELFAINVYKIRELLTYQEPLRMPNVGNSPVKGVLKIRGDFVAVFDLAQALGYPEHPPLLNVVAEFGGQAVAFPVVAVTGIEKCDWDKVIPAEELLGPSALGRVTGLAKLDDGRLLTILDVESIVGTRTNIVPSEQGLPKLSSPKTVLFADDSQFARKIVQATLDAIGANSIETHDGQAAWERLQSLAQSGSLPDAVVTDVEMPNLDGYALTRKIKADARFAKVKVLMYSSLSADANFKMGIECGADAYCAKFENSNLAMEIKKLLS